MDSKPCAFADYQSHRLYNTGQRETVKSEPSNIMIEELTSTISDLEPYNEHAV